MSYRLAFVALLSLALVGCDVAQSGSGPTPAPSASAAGSAGAGSAVPGTPAPTAVATATAAPVAPTNAPPPPPPPPAAAPKIAVVPASGTVGTTFVFQLSGFPKSAAGQDLTQTVTTPAGKAIGPTIGSTRPDGTGLTTYTPTGSDPAGLYLVKITVVAGGVSAQTTFQVR